MLAGTGAVRVSRAAMPIGDGSASRIKGFLFLGLKKFKEVLRSLKLPETEATEST